ncbi:competence protein CoiA family protein [Kitasatospora sp. NPDC088134]|uniref:competence protein CoiA family protein n=1 Tax=Kitasatospora sp. NPDC088134 TaxID=3364071 RepID=UPI0037F153E8
MIGSGSSDLAIILPMQADELAVWRRKHPTYTYWCGTLLGGCGEPLTDRLYTDKVCHFAHHPHHACTRTATGEDSADHLFMRQTLVQWLPEQGFAGDVRWARKTEVPNSGIDVDLYDGRTLRIRLGRGAEHLWGASAEVVRPGRGDWVFGTGMPVPREFFDEQGFVFRIRFETRGAERCPYLGVQQATGGIEWAPFTQAVLTGDGLTTPATRKIRATRRKTPVGDPATVPRSSTDTDSGPRDMDGDVLVTALREALELDARWGNRPTWTRLMQTVDTDLSSRSDEELQDILAAVDQVFHRNDPVLSALIRTESGDPLPFLPDVLEDLGIGRASSSAQLRRWCQRESDRAFAKYGVPPRTMPSPLPLDAAVPEILVGQPLQTRQRRSPVSSRPPRQAPDRTAQRQAAERDALEKLVAEGRTLAKTVTDAATKKRLTDELRLARRYLQGTLQTADNKRGSQLLRSITIELEAAIAATRAKADKKSRKERRSQPDTPAVPRLDETIAAEQRPQHLRDHLIAVARQGGTTTWPQLPKTTATASDAERRRLLTAVEREASWADGPLMSALVTTADGGPPAYFRGILKNLGFAVPVSDEVLLKIWHRERQRAYAAYAVPSQPVPPRLVPRAADVGNT